MSTVDAADHAAADHGHTTNLGMSNEKLGMWTFIGSECLFFGAMIATYLLYLNRTNDGLTAFDVFDIPFTSASTFILLMSSLGMVLALDALQRRDMRAFQTWTLATALMGMVFLAGQMYEFAFFVEEGFKLETSPFSVSFFMLTGFHGVHVTVGVVMLVALWALSLRGGITADKHLETVELVGLYWHFVDIVWIVIFTVIYLIPVG
ncbi:cytochrome c oxidase subunit 3 [Euzebya tangerina]|uniref:cytochrome c oxidase subunit 3 n=1 Tax=Euzebya tangerina TaxID=591198 RepID=UPI000E316A1D|nr:heme-copper oxidase subunit III [Euzebya tangerina]